MRARVTDFDRAPASNSSQGLLLILSRCDNHPEAGRFELASYVVEPVTSRVDVFARHKNIEALENAQKPVAQLCSHAFA